MADTAHVDAAIPQEADDYALIWGGQDQHAGRRPADEKFAGNLAAVKRQFAEQCCDAHWYLTAEYGFVAPDDTLPDSDTTIAEIDVDEWVTHTQTAMAMSHFCVLEGACLWVLVDDAVLHRESEDGTTLKQTLDALPYWVRYPFAEQDHAQKIAWLEDSLDKGVPLDQGVPVVGH